MLVGLDVLRRGKNGTARRRLGESRIGLLTHGAAVDEYGVSTWSVLRELDIAPRVVFSPEHGLDGIAQAEEAVGVDDANVGGTRLVSLYGHDKESLTPKSEDLDDLDVLLVDLVDIGSRYYTYVWTALLAARAAIAKGVHVMVLDRPNPIGGDPARAEGRPQDPDFCSFVGLVPIPIRHSLTIGELLVGVLNQEDVPLGPEGALSVVPTEGWERYRLAERRPFVPPSPNMPTLETALVYPGACLLEGTNLSEGRGTTRPFQTLGAPFLNAEELARALGRVPGAWVRPVRFKPTFDKHVGKVCSGIMLHVTDPATFRPVESYLRIVSAAHALAPDDFRFLDRVYEFEANRPAFDLLTGSSEARSLVERGGDVDELVSLVCPVDADYAERVAAAEELLDEVRA